MSAEKPPRKLNTVFVIATIVVVVGIVIFSALADFLDPLDANPTATPSAALVVPATSKFAHVSHSCWQAS